MNCNKNRNSNPNHSMVKHTLHMVLCCGLPILIIAILPFIARYSTAAAGILGVIAPFICPLMMGGMIFMMFFRSKKANCCSDEKAKENNNE